MVLWSKEDLKQKCFLICLTLILMVFFVVFHYVTGAALSNEDLTKAFKQLGVKFEADQTKVKLHKFLYVCLNCRLKNNYDDNITRKINHSKRFKNTLNFEP